MGNRFLLLACILVIALGIFVVPFPDGAVAIGMVSVMSALLILIFRKYTDEKQFVTTIFLVALAVRMAFGVLIHLYEMQGFFGGDYLAYDINGSALVDVWLGHAPMTSTLIANSNPIGGAGWGMNYFTGILYFILGRNLFAAQSFCAVIGAATAPMVFFCSKKIFNNLKVSKAAAIGIALFPSFIIWSGQLLKDGLIIFLLVLTMTMVLQLQEKFGYAALSLLIFSMFAILSLRFYTFYMVVIAVVGSFVIGVSSSQRSILRTTIIMVLIGFSLSYLGVGRQADVDLSTFANLDRIQSSRSDLTHAADSGFNEDADVSTTEGALTALPIGFLYLMFAPFPWQTTNVRQAITIPEVLLWWALIPFLISGLIYTIRNRLRNAFPVLMFSLMLTIAYSVSQGNVGTAYRQRTQIQVFLFILIGVGYTLYQERRENEKLLRSAAKQRIDDQLRGGLRPTNI